MDDIKKQVIELQVNLFRDKIGSCDDPQQVNEILDKYLKDPTEELLEEIEFEFSPTIIRNVAVETTKLEEKLNRAKNKNETMSNILRYTLFLPVSILVGFVGGYLGNLLIDFWEYTSTPLLKPLLNIEIFDTISNVIANITYIPILLCASVGMSVLTMKFILPQKYKKQILTTTCIFMTLFLIYTYISKFDGFWSIYGMVVSISILWFFAPIDE